MPDMPTLLKERQLHSRIFAGLAILVLLVTRPESGRGIWYTHGMIWGGYMLVIIGALGRIYCSMFIGGRKNDVIVQDGPFSIVRNPLYVFSFLATAGIGMQSQMLTVVVALVVVFALYYARVVAREEAFLKHKFGEVYDAYMQEVPRWWPNFSLWSEPQQVEARPPFLRRTAMDAAIFFLPLPCFVIIGKLQAAQVLPVWLTLP